MLYQSNFFCTNIYINLVFVKKIWFMGKKSKKAVLLHWKSRLKSHILFK
jgi:hypothetical protein